MGPQSLQRWLTGYGHVGLCDETHLAYLTLIDVRFFLSNVRFFFTAPQRNSYGPLSWGENDGKPLL